MAMLKLSVITVCYNNKNGLLRTIRSVIDQTYTNVEIIIIDGGSSDGVKDVIDEFNGRIDFFRSERDRGIFDAMNKGMEVATGDFCIFLNSGDVFYSSTVIEMFISLVKDLNVVYFGRACIVGGKEEWLFPDKSFDAKRISYWLKAFEPNHQSMFFPQSFYSNHKYDIKFRYTADHGFKILAHQICDFVFVDIVVCKFFMGGVSNNSSFSVQLRRIKECLLSLDMGKRRLGFKASLLVFMRIISFLLNQICPRQYHRIVRWYHGTLSYSFYSYIRGSNRIE